MGRQRHEKKKDNRERSIKKYRCSREGKTNTGEVRGYEPDPDLVSAVHRSLSVKSDVLIRAHFNTFSSIFSTQGLPPGPHIHSLDRIPASL